MVDVRRNRWSRWANVLLLAALALVGGSRPLMAAEGVSRYPHVNLATSYRVDPTWPQRPSHVAWGDMSSVAIDRANQVWIFTRAKPPVQVYDAAGRFVRGWGDDFIQRAHGLKLAPDGNVWLTDVGSHVVMRFTPEGKLRQTLGTRGVPGDDQTHFNRPTDLVIAPDGELFVADGYGNNRIVHLDRDGRFIESWGQLGTKPGEFSLPHAIVRDAQGRFYVADRNNARIQVFNQRGRYLDQWRNLLVPWGLFVADSGDIWACGSSPMTWVAGQEYLGLPPKDQLVMRLSPEGKLLALWTIPKGADGKERPGEVNWLHCIAVDSHGDLYLGDIQGRRIQKFVRQDAAPSPAP
jgi:DNA-binding beta-propeller fold protein YncE